MLSKSTLLAALAVVLAIVGFVAFAADQLMVAGVSFFAVSLTIYAREKSL